MSLRTVNEDARTDLYEGHVIKKELVVGPVELQQCDVAYQLNDKSQPSNMKEHIAIRSSDSPIFNSLSSVKQEPPWADNCMVNIPVQVAEATQKDVLCVKQESSIWIGDRNCVGKTPTQVNKVTQEMARNTGVISKGCGNGDPAWNENCMVKIPTQVNEVTQETDNNTYSAISMVCVKVEPPWDDNCMVKIPTQVNEVTQETDSLNDSDTFTAAEENCMDKVRQETDCATGHAPLIGVTYGDTKNLDNCIARIPSHMDEVVKRELLKEDSDCEVNGPVQKESKDITHTVSQDGDDGVPSIDDKLLRSRYIKIQKQTPSRLRILYETDTDSDGEIDRKKQKNVDFYSSVQKSKKRNKQKKTSLDDSKRDILNGKKQKKIQECNYCGKRFSFRAGLTNHLRTHTGEKPYSCKICDKRFSDCAVLVRHRRMHSGEKPHGCDICGKKYSEKYLLKNHKLTHTGEMQYFCKFCPKQFVNSSNYRRHQQIHAHKYICDLCKKHFEKKDMLVSHIKSHLKPRPFLCKFCDKSFSQNGHLNRHLAIHTGPKKVYDCGVCKKVFSQKISLDKHVKKRVCEKKRLA